MISTPITLNIWADRIVIVRNNDGEQIDISYDDALTLADRLSSIVAQQRDHDRLSEHTDKERQRQ